VNEEGRTSDPFPVRGTFSARLQDHIRILDGVACSNQPDGFWHPLFELDVRLIGDRDISEYAGEKRECRRLVNLEELFGHIYASDYATPFHCTENLDHSRDIIDQRYVDGLEFRPEGKTPVGYHQIVCVPEPADEGVDVRVKDAGFYHGFNGLQKMGCVVVTMPDRAIGSTVP